MSEASHDQVRAVWIKKDQDWEPFGKTPHPDPYNDCSCGCTWFHILEGVRGMDWGVCFNPRSHRAGLLTFEHQGCDKFEEEEWEAEWEWENGEECQNGE